MDLSLEEKAQVRELTRQGGWEIALKIIASKVRDIASVDYDCPLTLEQRREVKKIIVDIFSEVYGVSVETKPTWEDDKPIFIHASE